MPKYRITVAYSTIIDSPTKMTEDNEGWLEAKMWNEAMGRLEVAPLSDFDLETEEVDE